MTTKRILVIEDETNMRHMLEVLLRTNCREANQYLHREDRRGWELKQIAARAWEV